MAYLSCDDGALQDDDTAVLDMQIYDTCESGNIHKVLVAVHGVVVVRII